MINLDAAPYPLGATLIHQGCQFSIHAPAIDELWLVLFDEKEQPQFHLLTQDYAGIKYLYLDDIKAGQLYCYACLDTNNEQEQKWFYLSDPYAKAVAKPLHYQPPFTREASQDLARCVVIDPYFDWQNTQPLYRPLDEMILFETHVKGATQLNPLVEPSQQGRYLGLVSDAMLQFYHQQHINTVQLLPIAACMHEPHLLNDNKVNYWGYNPFVFMAPDPRYANLDAVNELKTVVRELHKAGIEVILDVVYNHTAEGGEGGNVFNLKALDPQYYLMREGHFLNYTGCGNTLDLSYQASLTLVMDTLRYWVSEFHIDGFRFDLAATLGRNGDHFSAEAAFFKAVAQDPVLRKVKLIAEPWDIGPDGYQVGHFPLGWNETNDKLRDTSRSFWRGEAGFLHEFATRLMGSRDLYSAALWPYKLTVNYVTYHDGFTLQDLVSYRKKHNEANGEENRDGHNDNRSENYGVEGETDNLIVQAVRERQKRNFMASLLFSFGIPHLLLADVLSHSQQGNNNAYCQDNAISWLNWELPEYAIIFQQWLADMVLARQTYMLPFIRAFSGKQRLKNRVFWRRCQGQTVNPEEWSQLRAVALHLGIDNDGQELLYLINQTNAPICFTLPNDRDQQWKIICDSNLRRTKEQWIKDTKQQLAMSITILHYSPPINSLNNEP